VLFLKGEKKENKKEKNSKEEKKRKKNFAEISKVYFCASSCESEAPSKSYRNGG
jgi:hypothetical protein